MKIKKCVFFIGCLLLYIPVSAQVSDSLLPAKEKAFYRYIDTTNKELIVQHKEKELVFDKRGLFYFARYVPKDMWQITKSPFQKANLKLLSIAALSTGILLPVDQPAMDGVRKFSKNIHLSDKTSYGVALGAGKVKIIKYPKNINSALYQLGEGGTSMFLAGGLWIYGKLKNDYRAIQTAGDLVETFIIMGVSTQILKRISGRESPFVATQKGGTWRPFPSFNAYQQHTPRYDAFPSGHLATMMATVTVLTSNYPEKKWIKPVGYSIIGLTAWAMMNTEVHWISDYPLALALGYVSGKISTLRHSRAVHQKSVSLRIQQQSAF